MRVSNDTAAQDCEGTGRCPLPLYAEFPLALFLEPIGDAVVKPSHSRSCLPVLTAVVLDR